MISSLCPRRLRLFMMRTIAASICGDQRQAAQAVSRAAQPPRRACPVGRCGGRLGSRGRRRAPPPPPPSNTPTPTCGLRSSSTFSRVSAFSPSLSRWEWGEGPSGRTREQELPPRRGPPRPRAPAGRQRSAHQARPPRLPCPPHLRRHHANLDLVQLGAEGVVNGEDVVVGYLASFVRGWGVDVECSARTCVGGDITERPAPHTRTSPPPTHTLRVCTPLCSWAPCAARSCP